MDEPGQSMSEKYFIPRLIGWTPVIGRSAWPTYWWGRRNTFCILVTLHKISGLEALPRDLASQQVTPWQLGDVYMTPRPRRRSLGTISPDGCYFPKEA